MNQGFAAVFPRALALATGLAFIVDLGAAFGPVDFAGALDAAAFAAAGLFDAAVDFEAADFAAVGFVLTAFAGALGAAAFARAGFLVAADFAATVALAAFATGLAAALGFAAAAFVVLVVGVFFGVLAKSSSLVGAPPSGFGGSP